VSAEKQNNAHGKKKKTGASEKKNTSVYAKKKIADGNSQRPNVCVERKQNNAKEKNDWTEKTLNFSKQNNAN
jgi:hypothetical protein